MRRRAARAAAERRLRARGHGRTRRRGLQARWGAPSSLQPRPRRPLLPPPPPCLLLPQQKLDEAAAAVGPGEVHLQLGYQAGEVRALLAATTGGLDKKLGQVGLDLGVGGG